MKINRIASSFLLAVVALFAVAFVNAQTGQASPPAQAKPDVFSATAFQRGLGPKGTFGMTLTIKGYSSDAQAHEFARVLRTQGADGLIELLRKGDSIGRIAADGKVGSDVVFIRSNKTATGRQITMVTDRPLPMIERARNPRSRQYEFGIVQLQINDNGTNTGVMYAAAKLKFDKNDQLIVEHYGVDPVELRNVRKMQ
jgi:hypothetical protein